MDPRLHALAIDLAETWPRLLRHLAETLPTSAQELHAAPGRTRLLRLLGREGPLTGAEISRTDGIRQPLCSRLLRELADAGLVVEELRVRRGRPYAITPKGRWLLEQITEARAAALEDRLSRLSTSEIDALERASRILRRLRNSTERRSAG